MKKLLNIAIVLTLLGFSSNSYAQFTVDFDNTYSPVLTLHTDIWTPAQDCFLYTYAPISSYIPSIDAVGNTSLNWTDIITPVLSVANDSMHIQMDVVVPEAGTYWYFVGRANASNKQMVFYAPVGTMMNANSSYTLSAPSAGTYTISFWVQNTQYAPSYTTAVANSADIGKVKLLIRQGASSSVTMGFKKITVTNGVYSPTGTPCVVNLAATCPDADADGVCDSQDDFPNDADRAYSSTMPWMTWMYEDLFPAYGDFDFNDLVVSAKREIITDADNDVRFIKLKAVVKAAGAGIPQGWAFELSGTLPSDVVSVNGSHVVSNTMSLNGNGTENAQTYAVIPVFDNFNNVIYRAGGAFFNTVYGTPTGHCDTIEVMVELKKSGAYQISDLNFNFFSFRTNNRAHEIHEMGYAPTSLADATLFGTKMDATDLNSGDTYVSVDGLPWAISSAGSAYAIEKTDIVEAFLKMAAWAQSGGTQFQDWHTNTSEGIYRSSAKIY
jgi:LruC domain-containing protein